MTDVQQEIARLEQRLAELKKELSRQSREMGLCQKVIESAGVGIGVCLPDGRMTAGNQRMSELWGYSEEEFYRLNIRDLMHPDELPQVKEMIARLLEGEFPAYTREGRYRRKDGSWMWLNASVAPVRGEDGRVSHLAAVFADISDRKSMEEAHKLDKERLRTITENSPDYILMLDPDGVIRFANRDIGKLPPDQIRGRSLLDMIPEDKREEAKECMEEVLSSLKPSRFRVTYGIPGGRNHHFGVRLAPVEDGGRAVSLVMSATDITQGIEAEQELKKSEELFRLISENTHDLICLHDTDGCFIYVSPSVTKQLGYAPQEILGKLAMDFIHPEDLESSVYDVLERVVQGDADTYLHCRIRHKDGHYIWMETLPIPFLDDNGEFCQMLTSSRDITKRKLAEEALLQLAYGVSHNFNNTLMAVMSNAQAAQDLLEKQDEPSLKAAELLDNVIRAARSGRNLVSRLSRHVTGLQYNSEGQEPLDMGELLKEAADLAEGTWPQFRRGSHILRFWSQKGLVVRGVKGELLEVLLNLIKNAVEAMPDSGVISLSASAQGSRVELLVEDSGLGLDATLRDQIFNPFISSKGREGMGLGLTMSRAIIESHHGSITATNSEAGGAQFVINLPAYPAEPSHSQAPVKPDQANGEPVLVVEDESLVGAGIKAILKRAGYTVRMATNVREALDSMLNQRFKVVLCDLGLPDGSGWEVVSAAAEQPEPPRVIILTGWAGTEEADPPEGSPRPFAVLPKPMERQALVREVKRAAQNGEGESSMTGESRQGR